MINVLRYDYVVMFYCNNMIPFNTYVKIILCWCYDYVMFLKYIWIEKINDSDDLPLTQMVLQRTTGVSSEDKDAEDDEYDEKNEEMSNAGEN